MNKQIRRLTIAVLVIYGALFLRMNQVQVLQASDYNKRPDNTRQIEAAFDKPRGTISTIDGKVLARSVETGGKLKYQRVYPTDDLFAHVVGTYSLTYGSDGVERTYDDALTGRLGQLQVKGFANPFVERSNAGNVVLTLRSDVQQVAKDQLGTRKGSIVAIDPLTGAIEAMWSYPSYDPNPPSSNDPKLAKASRLLLQASPDKPLLAKAYRDRFFPGSTFKIVTSSAGLESGKVDVTMPSFPVVTSYTPPLTTRPISNFDGAACGGTLFQILKVSCNSSFAQMGAEVLGPDPMIGEAEKFGFNQKVPIDLPEPAQSNFPQSFGKRVRAGATPGAADVYENTPALAQASIGQNDVAATPLEMAMVAAAVANGGVIMRPHVMDHIEDSDGGVVQRFEAGSWTTPISQANAETMRQGMIGVVQGGTATRAAIPGLEVGAKTGTAQVGTTPPRSHVWTIAFAGQPGQPASIAVAVLVEGQPGYSEQTGGRVAAPIAQAVMKAALSVPPKGK